jgi:hypothetical protein
MKNKKTNENHVPLGQPTGYNSEDDNPVGDRYPLDDNPIIGTKPIEPQTKIQTACTINGVPFEPKSQELVNSTTGKGGGLRFNKNKLRYDLVHPLAHEDMVKVLTHGANKYTVYGPDGEILNNGSNNWQKGLTWTSVIASLKRHIAAIERGEDYDQDSGLLHISHAACNVHFLNAYYYIFPQGDDRVKRLFNLPKIGLDIDEVICSFLNSWMPKYGVDEFPNSWWFDRKIKERFEEMRVKGELNDFYLNMKPLITGEDLPFEPHCYITSRPVSKEITEQWLDKYGFPTKPVYTVDINHSKVQIAKEAGIEIFIDDSYDNFLELNQNGIFCYLFTQKHNLKYNVGHMRLNSLKELPLLK